MLPLPRGAAPRAALSLVIHPALPPRAAAAVFSDLALQAMDMRATEAASFCIHA